MRMEMEWAGSTTEVAKNEIPFVGRGSLARVVLLAHDRSDPGMVVLLGRVIGGVLAA